MRRVVVQTALIWFMGLNLLVVLTLGQPAPAGAQGIWPWTSYRLVTEEDLAPLSLRDLEIMRNEIYARRGWVFARPELRGYFERQPWYRPKGTPANREEANRWATAELSRLERQNIARIQAFERTRRAFGR